MLGPRAISLWGMRTQVEQTRVEGLEHVPTSGPLILVGRHYHHLLDGSMLVTSVGRPLHIVVGLDWAGPSRPTVEWACRSAEYPIVLRAGNVETGEQLRYLRAAFRETTRLLVDGRALVVFPEGYPTIDPAFTPKQTDDEFLPFASGFLRMAQLAERAGSGPVALVPVGFSYARSGKKWSIVMRFGPALTRAQIPGGDVGAAAMQTLVRELSHA